MSDRVTISVDDRGIADVRLNRPEKRNALDGAMFAGLRDAGEQLKAEPGVRVVVLSGEGESFCAGLDFSSFQSMAGGERTQPVAADGNPERPTPGGITHLGQQVALGLAGAAGAGDRRRPRPCPRRRHPDRPRRRHPHSSTRTRKLSVREVHWGLSRT